MGAPAGPTFPRLEAPMAQRGAKAGGSVDAHTRRWRTNFMANKVFEFQTGYRMEAMDLS